MNNIRVAKEIIIIIEHSLFVFDLSVFDMHFCLFWTIRYVESKYSKMITDLTNLQAPRKDKTRIFSLNQQTYHANSIV